MGESLIINYRQLKKREWSAAYNFNCQHNTMSMAAMRLANALVCHVCSATRDDNCAYCFSSCCDRNDASVNGCHNYTDRFAAVYLVAVVCLMDYCT